VIFVIEQGLPVLGIQHVHIFTFKDLRGLFPASFLQFIQFLIRLRRSVGAEAEKSGNRTADGRLHFHGPPSVEARLFAASGSLCCKRSASRSGPMIRVLPRSIPLEAWLDWLD
jgi:hypothetical protein